MPKCRKSLSIGNCRMVDNSRTRVTPPVLQCLGAPKLRGGAGSAVECHNHKIRHPSVPSFASVYYFHNPS